MFWTSKVCLYCSEAQKQSCRNSRVPLYIMKSGRYVSVLYVEHPTICYFRAVLSAASARCYSFRSVMNRLSDFYFVKLIVFISCLTSFHRSFALGLWKPLWSHRTPGSDMWNSKLEVSRFRVSSACTILWWCFLLLDLCRYPPSYLLFSCSCSDPIWILQLFLTSRVPSSEPC